MIEKLKTFLASLLFPKFCFGCQKEGNYLCQDCKSILDVLNFHQFFKTEEIDELYFSTGYKNSLLKDLIKKFKYQPFIKELSLPLSSLIIDHFQLLDNPPLFCKENLDFVLIPIPLEKRRLKWRGFNQAQELAKHLSEFLDIPLVCDVLIKKQKTLPQVRLSDKERRKNISGSFSCKNQKKILEKKILLIDDIYTTGSTMKESAKVLKKSGAKKIIGITIARALPGEDRV
jgi:ComF family protein